MGNIPSQKTYAICCKRLEDVCKTILDCNAAFAPISSETFKGGIKGPHLCMHCCRCISCNFKCPTKIKLMLGIDSISTYPMEM